MGFDPCCLPEALHIRETLLQRLAFFAHFRVHDRSFGIAVIVLQTKGDQPIANHIFLRRPAMNVGPC